MELHCSSLEDLNMTLLVSRLTSHLQLQDDYLPRIHFHDYRPIV